MKVTKIVFPQRIRALIQFIENAEEINAFKLRKFIEKSNVQEADLMPWSNFDHPIEDSYGRKLLYDNGRFEIMVMSWQPGDFASIHDHGYTQWGCVQVFGEAEHATFSADEDTLTTSSRIILRKRSVLQVNHSLIHQMGNPTDKPFLSLHIYGIDYPLQKAITSEARVFNTYYSNIQRMSGGMFFAAPMENINVLEDGPTADFPTYIRDVTEIVLRLRKITTQGKEIANYDNEAVIQKLFTSKNRRKLLQTLNNLMDDHYHHKSSNYWKVLIWEVKKWASLQQTIKQEQNVKDSFHKYASLYDALIGTPCLENFMAKYLAFFFDNYISSPLDVDFISLGCGTGLVEEYIINHFNVPAKNMFGFDISAAMVEEARQRIQADVGDVLQLDPTIKLWDVAYTGLNVFHYINHSNLKQAIERAASIIKPGGYFLGDFITPDHIRWYPNVMFGDDKKIISLRTPLLVEQEGKVFQESEIINLDFRSEEVEVNYAGKHLRFLPPMHRVRLYFEEAFQGKVTLFDAYSLAPIPEEADTCPSTRYVLVAQKGKHL